jgi:methanogenic corrinoid protein MtbC1
MSTFVELSRAVEGGKRNDAKQLTQALLEQDVKPLEGVEQGLVPGMSVIGEKFKNNEVFVPEMLIAARAMKECMAILEPLLADAGIKPKFTAVIGTVQGDLHDIGKNLVAMMLKGANFVSSISEPTCRPKSLWPPCRNTRHSSFVYPPCSPPCPPCGRRCRPCAMPDSLL